MAQLIGEHMEEDTGSKSGVIIFVLTVGFLAIQAIGWLKVHSLYEWLFDPQQPERWEAVQSFLLMLGIGAVLFFSVAGLLYVWIYRTRRNKQVSSRRAERQTQVARSMTESKQPPTRGSRRTRRGHKSSWPSTVEETQNSELS